MDKREYSCAERPDITGQSIRSLGLVHALEERYGRDPKDPIVRKALDAAHLVTDNREMDLALHFPDCAKCRTFYKRAKRSLASRLYSAAISMG